MNICPVGAELLHADRQTQTDRQTDMTKLTVIFCTFMNVPNDNGSGAETECLHGTLATRPVLVELL